MNCLQKILFFSLSYICISYVVVCFNPCSENNRLVTDLQSSTDCGEGYFYLPNGNPTHECFPRCIQKYDISSTPCSDSVPCPQGYKCPKKIDEKPTYCTVDYESCFKYHIENKPDNVSAWWKPECLPNGDWAPKQCKGEHANGRCFCSDSRGNRIYGEAFVQDSADMSCACSRKRSENLKLQSHGSLNLHCESNGNYEQLQCDKGHCLCVNPKTGKITSKIVTERMMKLLPCYDSKVIGEKYLRQCESEKYAQEEILKELEIHGTDNANIVPILCDGDGTYGAKKILSGQIICTWKDNSQIESFSSSIDQKTSVDCNCARDIKLYESRGHKQTLICSTNGNYRPEQQINGKWYCVDQDGFRKSNFSDTMPDDCDMYH